MRADRDDQPVLEDFSQRLSLLASFLPSQNTANNRPITTQSLHSLTHIHRTQPTTDQSPHKAYTHSHRRDQVELSYLLTPQSGTRQAQPTATDTLLLNQTETQSNNIGVAAADH